MAWFEIFTVIGSFLAGYFWREDHLLAGIGALIACASVIGMELLREEREFHLKHQGRRFLD